MLRQICVVLLLCLATPALADKRVALVVGMSAYQHTQKLPNTVNDARGMRAALTKLGFDVIYGEDLDQRDLNKTIGKFADAADGADVAIAYYAGHGATFGGIPYVVPTDAEFSSLSNIPYELVPVETFIKELRRAKGVRVAILDACRDNEAEAALKRSATRGIGESHGLGRVSDAEGLIIAYSTQYLSTASDGGGGNSPFTGAILRNIATPGLDVTDLFREVAREVRTETKGEQTPEISLSLFDKYYLGGEAQVAAISPLSRDQLLLDPKQAADECKRRMPPFDAISLDGRKVATTAAKDICAKAVAADPDNVDLVTKLAQAYWAAGDNGKAFSLARTAADKGSSDAMCILGLLKGQEASNADEKAKKAISAEGFEWFEKASEKGNKTGQLAVALFYVTGVGASQDVPRGVKVVMDLAESGDAPAMLMLSAGYEFGVGVPKDARLKASWLEKAAATGYPSAVVAFALTLENGDDKGGVAKDVTRAASLYRQAADAGNVDAMIAIARCYETGLGVRKSSLDASDWYRKAIAAGGPRTAIDIATSFRWGSPGFPKDETRAIDFYQQAADAGELEGVKGLAHVFADDKSSVHDESRATAAYLQAANDGDPSSMIVVGGRYLKGLGTSPNKSEAATWFAQAAEKGGLDAMRSIAGLYATGYGSWGSGDSLDDMPVDKLRASEWYRRILDNGGTTEDMLALAELYAASDSVVHDDAAAAALYRQAADKGDVGGMIAMAMCLAAGTGVGADPAAAASWLDKAAGTGDPDVMKDVGDMFATGSGGDHGHYVSNFPVDAAHGAEWYAKAADAGNAAAMVALATAYHGGTGVPRDEATATSWLQKAVEKNSNDAMRLLADRYLRGLGVKKDASRAFALYSKAADNGYDPESDVELGRLYETGIGTRKDPAKAVELYRKVSDVNAAAMVRLAICYRDGRGVARDPAEAKRLFGEAASRGDAFAAKALEQMRAQP